MKFDKLTIFFYWLLFNYFNAFTYFFSLWTYFASYLWIINYLYSFLIFSIKNLWSAPSFDFSWRNYEDLGGKSLIDSWLIKDCFLKLSTSFDSCAPHYWAFFNYFSRLWFDFSSSLTFYTVLLSIISLSYCSNMLFFLNSSILSSCLIW